MKGSVFLGLRRTVAYLLWTVMCMPIQALLVLSGLPARSTFPRFYHSVCLKLLGFRLVVRGKMTDQRPTLFVSNHSSYLDIMVLGGLIKGSFVAKSEVAMWPLFGWLAKLQRTVFVDRRMVNARRDGDAVGRRLAAGDNLILFPEGTSSDGNRTLPFKSALFAVAATPMGDKQLHVQPVSVACTNLDGIPLGRRFRWLYAWYGDMALAPHLWSVVRLGDLTVTVQFHKAVTLAELGSRKALADHCWRAVATGVAAANAGRMGLRDAA